MGLRRHCDSNAHKGGILLNVMFKCVFLKALCDVVNCTNTIGSSFGWEIQNLDSSHEGLNFVDE